MSVTLTPITHFKGARQPPLYSTLTADDPAFDPIPASATATFYMRDVDSSTPYKVNGAAAVVTSEPANTLRYDWAAADVDTAGFYVGWFRVTLAGGQYAETPEFLIWIKDHVGLDSYVSSEELKSTLAIKSDYANADLEQAVEAASRAIDARTGRTFTLGAAGEVRTYSTVSPTYVEIDDAVAITSVVVNGTAAVSGTDYNQVAGGVGYPISSLESIGGYTFPTRSRVIVVTGTFGWTEVPAQIKTATKIIASRLLQRARSAAFGVVGLGFEGAAVHIARFDPDLDLLLEDFERSGGSLAQ